MDSLPIESVNSPRLGGRHSRAVLPISPTPKRRTLSVHRTDNAATASPRGDSRETQLLSPSTAALASKRLRRVLTTAFNPLVSLSRHPIAPSLRGAASDTRCSHYVDRRQQGHADKSLGAGVQMEAPNVLQTILMTTPLEAGVSQPRNRCSY